MQTKCSDISAELESWYLRENGRYLLDATRRALARRLDTTFGYHILQLSPLYDATLCEASPIHHRIHCGEVRSNCVDLMASAQALPLESDSVDAIVAHHSLEFAVNPHAVLREIQRVLTPQGRLLIVGFNPHSLHGGYTAVRGWLRSPLWSEHRAVSEGRLTDWLHLLGCEVQEVVRLYGVPPIGRGRVRRSLVRMDQWAGRHNLPGSGLYLLNATKQVAGLHRPRRRVYSRQRLIGLVPKPAAAPSSPAAQPNVQSKKNSTAA
ncbi:MAG: class I SAM-dependent methyltransferase [Pseudomonadota bacterium]